MALIIIIGGGKRKEHTIRPGHSHWESEEYTTLHSRKTENRKRRRRKPTSKTKLTLEAY